MPQLVFPFPQGSELDSPEVQQFFEIMRKQINQPAFYSQATDPGAAGIPNGTWSIWLNTTSGVLKLWANQAGVLKSVTLT